MSEKTDNTNPAINYDPATHYMGYLIDPFSKSITPVAIQKEDELKSIRSLIDVELIDRVALSNTGDMLIVDDEGLYAENQAFFYVQGVRLAGKSLLVGGGEGGTFASPDATLEWAKEYVGFEPDKFRQWIDTFIAEKEIDPLHLFHLDTDGEFFQIHLGKVVEIICSQSDEKFKKWAMARIIEDDLFNRNPLVFFEMVAKMIFESVKE